MFLLSSADFFFKINCLKNLSGILSECETVWIKIRTDECPITDEKNTFSLFPRFYCMSCLGCPSLKKPDFQDNGKNSSCLSRILRTSCNSLDKNDFSLYLKGNINLKAYKHLYLN